MRVVGTNHLVVVEWMKEWMDTSLLIAVISRKNGGTGDLAADGNKNGLTLWDVTNSKEREKQKQENVGSRVKRNK